jgi:DNA invertase Pin-like site-specific DNA recombinase
MNRPELIRLLGDAEPGDVILIEQVDRLTRLDDAGWETLRKQITDKQLAIVSLDLPTSHLALSSTVSDDFTRSMLKAVNGMLLDMLAAIARKITKIVDVVSQGESVRRKLKGNTGAGWLARNMN